MTPSMSSYLNVLCAGELDAIFDEEQTASTHRVVATKGKAEMGRYALESSAADPRLLSTITSAQPYPLPKLDHIAVPGRFRRRDGELGRDHLLRIAAPFRSREILRGNQAGHLRSDRARDGPHWFGDLVTMAWWDNLWLNEGFASWMGSKCTREIQSRLGSLAEQERPARSDPPPSASARKAPWKATRARPRIRSSNRSPTKRKRTALSTTSLTEKASLHHACSRVFSAKMFFATAFANTWRSTNFRTPPRPIFGTRSPKLRANRSEKSRRPGPNSPDFRSSKWRAIRRQNHAHAGALHGSLPERAAARMEDSPHLFGRGRPAGQLAHDLEDDGAPEQFRRDRAVKLNVAGAGNYRVQYDEVSWKLLLAELPKLSCADRVNLLSDAWALVQANRAPLSLYLEPGRKTARQDRAGGARADHARVRFHQPASGRRAAARRNSRNMRVSILRPSFDEVGWEPKSGEPVKIAMLRGEPDQGARRSWTTRRSWPAAASAFKNFSPIPVRSRRICARRFSRWSGVTPMKRPGTNCTSSA